MLFAQRHASLFRSLFVFWLVLSGLAFGCAGSKKDIEIKKQVDIDYQMAVNFFDAGETAQAIRSLALVLASDPNHAEANHLMGFIRMGRKQYPEAVIHFKRALETNPNMLTCKNNLGVAYLFLEQWEDAAVIFKALTQSPLYTSPWLAFVNLGWAYYKMGMLPEAREQTEMAIFLNPDLCLGMNNLGIIYQEIGRDSDAIKSLNDAVAACANYPEPHLHLGLIYARMGEIEKAYMHFKRCADLTPKSDLGKRCTSNAEAVR